MEKELQFTGILSDKAQENPGLVSQYLFMWYATMSVILRIYWSSLSFLQTSLTGIELSFGTVMALLSVEMVRMRLESLHYWVNRGFVLISVDLSIFLALFKKKLQAAQLQFRGERIWRAAIDDLKANGMRYADQVWHLNLLLIYTSGSKTKSSFLWTVYCCVRHFSLDAQLVV